MTNTNAYALSIQLTLDSNADTVLDGVLSKLDTLEQRIQNLGKTMGTSLENTARNVSTQINKIVKSTSKAKTDIIKESIKQPPSSLVDQDILKELSLKSLLKTEKEQNREKISFEKRETAYLRHINQAQDDYMATTGRIIDVNNANQIINEAALPLRREERNMLWRILSWEIRRYEEKLKLQHLGEAEKQTAQELLDNYKSAFQNIVKHEASVSKLKRIWNGINTSIGEIGNAIKGIGLGPLIEMTSITGLYETMIGRAAKREEEFHEIHYRTMGSMTELSRETRNLATSSGFLNEESIAATMALRNAGFQMRMSSEDAKEYAKNIMMLKRTTGASEESTSLFSKTMGYFYKKVGDVTNKVFQLQKSSKTYGLVGKEIELIMGKVAGASMLMGSKTEYVDELTESFIKVAASAKQMGVDVGKSISTMDRLRDPLESIAVLGSKVWELWQHPEEMRKELAKAAKAYMDYIDEIDDGKRKYTKMIEVAARFKVPIMQLQEELRVLAGSSEVAGQKTEKMLDPQTAMTEALKETGGQLRDLNNIIKDTLNKVEQRGEGFYNFITNILGTLRGDFASTLASLSIFGVGAISIIKTIFTTISKIFPVNLFGLLLGGSGGEKAAVTAGATIGNKMGTGLFKSIGRWITKILPLGRLLGKIIGAAFSGPVGWLITAGLIAWDIYNAFKGTSEIKKDDNKNEHIKQIMMEKQNELANKKNELAEATTKTHYKEQILFKTAGKSVLDFLQDEQKARNAGNQSWKNYDQNLNTTLKRFKDQGPGITSWIKKNIGHYKEMAEAEGLDSAINLSKQFLETNERITEELLKGRRDYKPMMNRIVKEQKQYNQAIEEGNVQLAIQQALKIAAIKHKGTDIIDRQEETSIIDQVGKDLKAKKGTTKSQETKQTEIKDDASRMQWRINRAEELANKYDTAKVAAEYQAAKQRQDTLPSPTPMAKESITPRVKSKPIPSSVPSLNAADSAVDRAAGLNLKYLEQEGEEKKKTDKQKLDKVSQTNGLLRELIDETKGFRLNTYSVAIT